MGQKMRASFTIGQSIGIFWACSGLNLCIMEGKVIGKPYFVSIT